MTVTSQVADLPACTPTPNCIIIIIYNARSVTQKWIGGAKFFTILQPKQWCLVSLTEAPIRANPNHKPNRNANKRISWSGVGYLVFSIKVTKYKHYPIHSLNIETNCKHVTIGNQTVKSAIFCTVLATMFSEYCSWNSLKIWPLQKKIWWKTFFCVFCASHYS